MSPFLNAPQRSADPARPVRITVRRVLVVGPVRAGTHVSQINQDLVIHTQYRHLTRPLLDRVRPDAVLAPLMTPEWDVLDLASTLSDLGYSGPLVLQSQPLPRADLVLGELQGLFPDLSMAFVEDAE
jgi:hypothetical protein